MQEKVKYHDLYKALKVVILDDYSSDDDKDYSEEEYKEKCIKIINKEKEGK